MILLVAFSYLLGSIPVGYILTRILKRVDIRRCGSGNPGATNVFRVVNPGAGVTALALDMLKGIIPVTAFADFLLHSQGGLDQITVRLILAIAAVCGHNWTIFLNFKGGKGVATSAGVLVGLSFKIPDLGLIVGLCLGVWLLVLLTTGYVSLSSIITVSALPIFMLVFNQPFKLVIFAAALCLFVVYRHKSNIRRLLRGEEGRIFRQS